MKRKTFIIIGACIGALVGAFLATGCERPHNPQVFAKAGQVVIIDSCEYVVCDASTRGQAFVHHGACRFCAKRVEEERAKFAKEVADRLIDVLYEE
jgi:hypothetical protein